MADKHSHPVRNGIIATVVGGLILYAIPSLRGFFVEMMSRVCAGVIWVWAALVSNYSVPGWVLLITGLFTLVGLVVGLVLLCVVLRPQNEPAHRNYTGDMLYGAKWRWSWNGNEISNLWCFCPTCDAQLVYSEDFTETNFICERCPSNIEDRPYRSQGRVIATVKGGDRYYAVNAAKREILRRIRTGENLSSNS